MASNVPYLKGVRTRYMNKLKKETETGLDLLSIDVSLVDVSELISKINSCVEKLQLYCDKFENQTEKLAEAVGESDSELTTVIISENESVCDKAFECALNLKEFKVSLSREKEKETKTKEKSNYDQIIELQKQMNEIVIHQMKQQHEFFEKKEMKEEELGATVKLPKLDLIQFSGDKLKWCEFWDAFENAVHNNKRLTNIEKFNYLKSKLSGEAKGAVLGLTLSKENYQVAIGILKERFGNEQEVIDLHYNQMINLLSASNTTQSLRELSDTMEKHLRSLEVLKQNINQDVFVSMIRAKLPAEVLLQLEILNGAKNKWTVDTLRNRLHEYIIAREHSESKGTSTNSLFKKTQHNRDGRQRYSPNVRSDQKNITHYERRMFNPSRVDKNSPTIQSSGSAEALVVNTKQGSATGRFYDQCRYCNDRHWSDECKKYSTLEERKKQLKDSCFKCLKVGHLSKDCKKNKSCVYCGEVNVHHRSLCPKKFKLKISSANLSEEFTTISEEGASTEENVLISSNELVLMQTARSEIKNPTNSKSNIVRILLDSGSQRTYITEELANKLQLSKDKEEMIKLVTFGSENPQIIKTIQTKLSLKLKNGQYMEITANIVPVISGAVQRKAMKFCLSEDVDHLVSSLDLADTIPRESESSSVELLIGSDYYLDIILSQKIEVQPGLYLLASKLGWILTGRTNEPDAAREETSMLIMTYGNNLTETGVFSNIDCVTPRKPDLEDFWNVEAIGILDKSNSTNDEMVKNHFKENLKFEDGRYQVKWPWKDDCPDLPVNRELALGRLKSNVLRMKNKPELIKSYDTIIQEQLNKGVIEKVEEKYAQGPKHYLPHHAVINLLKPTTKLRIVYDASAKSRKDYLSLNECLYRGPVLLNDLCGILMRFRLHNIGIVADLEKAFLQVGLQQSERDVTRFLWVKDCGHIKFDNSNIQEYRFCRVPFGVISSPFLLGATVEAHLELYGSEFAMKLKDDIYVDNVITGTNSIEDAVHLYREAKLIFRKASMNLREWVTSSPQVNQVIEKQDMAVCETTKVLGHTWTIESDTISLKRSNSLLEQTQLTKRNVLKEIASVFDPLGLFSPILLKGKLFLQTLWNKKLEWDDEISSEDLAVWLTISTELSKLPECSIKRNIALCQRDDTVIYRLVCFCDASACAYAAVVYLHQSINDSESKTDIIFSKTRLAPLKEMTIPRLEMMAVVIGVRCVKFVRDQLKLPIKTTYIWTDSQCVLKWINSNKDLSTFIKNRVKEIKSHDGIVFGFVTSKENPADIASRGSNVQNLRENHLWWHGPTWLSGREWPNSASDIDDKTTQDYESELKKGSLVTENASLVSDDISDTTTYSSGSCAPFDIESDKYSTVTKIVRVTAYVLRFIKLIRKSGGNTDSTSKYLTNKELTEAENMWLLYIQRKHFPEVFTAITSNKTNNLQRQLGIYLDNNGILRCKGRIENAEISEATRHPILLPKNDRFTQLTIECIHRQNFHTGISQTLSQVRHKYWIPQGRASVRSVLRHCHTCRRHEGGPYAMPMMPPLPKTRVTEARAFSRTGLDYLGPLYMKTNQERKKVWVCLFTCLVTRAIHLELMRDMTAEEFLLGLRRFISIRGAPVEILSDNASQFKTAKSVLDLAWKHVTKCEGVQCFVSTVGIKWSFIVELAPWMGGFYERLVGLVKRALRKSLGRNLLRESQLQTLLKEIESVINSRPLVYVGDDIESNITLTPGNFLTLNPNIGVPEFEYVQDDPDFNPYESSADRLLLIWKKGQKLLTVFWKIWRDEYLLNLREQRKSVLKSGRIISDASPNIGDVVLLKDDVPRCCWNMGKIVSLVTSKDGNIRSAKVKLHTGRVVGRPLSLLFPIEMSVNSDSVCKDRLKMYNQTEKARTASHTHSSNKYEVKRRPIRVAAESAKEKIKQTHES